MVKDLLKFYQWQKVLKYLQDCEIKQVIVYVSNLAKGINVTYSHTNNLVIALKDKCLIVTERDGRNLNIVLTSKGRRLSDCFKQAFVLMELE